MTDQPEPQVVGSTLHPGLYLVGTPIGNLEDITLRALRILRSADRIACEDTRQTQKLLNHFEIRTPTTSVHEHNERDRAAQLIAEIQSGKAIALVSDAGLPAISDPGHILTQAVIAAGLSVIPIPGPSAALTALIASGLATADFRFLGFLPEKAGARRSYIEALATSTSSGAAKTTLILYEAPHRIEETLADLAAAWSPQLKIVLARELTKLHEEFLRGTVAEVQSALASRDRIRGEITLLIEPLPLSTQHAEAPPSLLAQLKALETEGLDEKAALKRIARESGQSKSDLYRELQRQRAKR
ncbi:MAG TPA: 16S rRNA (cytidine(1402)-2'-O)-methyltransferase [Acidobacteriaceae bacterium]